MTKGHGKSSKFFILMFMDLMRVKTHKIRKYISLLLLNSKFRHDYIVVQILDNKKFNELERNVKTQLGYRLWV